MLMINKKGVLSYIFIENYGRVFSRNYRILELEGLVLHQFYLAEWKRYSRGQGRLPAVRWV